MIATPEPILSVRDLRVTFPSEAGPVHAVRGVDFDLFPGRTLGIVGESGSGKSVTSMAVMGLLPEYARIEGSAVFAGEELLTKSDKEMSKVRGKGIGMIFQDPLSALTPVFNVGDQIMEAIHTHQNVSKKQALTQAIELLDLVGIPEPDKRVRSFPHEFSGGMRQRVVIAIAIANNPRVLIADEPTTALDVTIQAQILDVIKLAQRETGAATIMITHDMGVVAGTADDVLVMYAGHPVEMGPVDTIFNDPRMPYTVGLLGSTPRVDVAADEPLTPIAGSPPVLLDVADQCQFAQRCPVALERCLAAEPPLRGVDKHHKVACVRSDEIAHGRIGDERMYPLPQLAQDVLADVPREQREITLDVRNLHKEFPLIKGAVLKRKVGVVHAVKGVDFEVRAGECMAIVGESGSGKTTTLLEVMDLQPAADTTLMLAGKDASTFSAAERRRARHDIQMVFQDPMSSLNPRMTIREIIAEPLESLGYDGDIDQRVGELMELVGLGAHQIDRFPGHFSGGQRQRIGLARALATNPKIIVLDEPVSALDVSIQAGVINLLEDLKRRLGLSYLFVAHDLSVVRHLSDRVAVMYKGEFVEAGDVDEIFDHPQHPYTKALLSAIPVPDPAVERERVRIPFNPDLLATASTDTTT
ncbi:dipeptide ABC transporter ATP-binding protein [Corynebacterium uberis]|uniref:dipeptide ABC transporter ATP-binding protein n=1 Tax=Corynebacterium TaxID=1716 RepID=UPI001D0A044C|nr:MULTISPECIES: ABC transporter ATP-binding protein [Corynebacterium]MCZ9308935.1 ABC transporter ATP-binding protein [Corynebacterium sp. c6VSa_13]UDL74594.1 ABC transporter ATP-binding protein [Corynebacterium uberis]UDL76572.1 ABC transporter ATP-binding protein [Corynebacterium uberis]UDL78785.1 ABC transporter ATP-binding protein [Corynebacterium uberis]UDL81063.1 ABC transporter ATP-binding protein [Corynebacterium uberis]